MQKVDFVVDVGDGNGYVPINDMIWDILQGYGEVACKIVERCQGTIVVNGMRVKFNHSPNRYSAENKQAYADSADNVLEAYVPEEVPDSSEGVNLLAEPVLIMGDKDADSQMVYVGYALGLEVGKSYAIKYIMEDGITEAIEGNAVDGEGSFGVEDTVVLGDLGDNSIEIKEGNFALSIIDKGGYVEGVSEGVSFYSDSDMLNLVGTLAGAYPIADKTETYIEFVIEDGDEDGVSAGTYYASIEGINPKHAEVLDEDNAIINFNILEEGAYVFIVIISIEEVEQVV